MFEKLIPIIEKANKIAIFTHTHPDGDAMGSSYALKLALTSIGKCCKVFLLDDPDASAFGLIIKGDDIELSLEDCDLAIALDCADSKRLGMYEEPFMSHPNSIAIDHHVTHVEFAKSGTVYSDISSTCELMFNLFKEMDISINKKLGKILAFLFCIAVFIGPGFLLPAMQTQTAATAVNVAFGLPFVVVGVIMTAIVAFVIMGGIKRIGQVAEFLAPVMCGIYFLITIIIIVLNIGKVPGMFGSIFASAFGKDAVFGGIVGSAVSWGIKRGFFSNDAGNGMSPLISATTDTSHPVKQGLVQG